MAQPPNANLQAAKAWATRIYWSVVRPANIDFLLWALEIGRTPPVPFAEDEWDEARRRYAAGERHHVAGSAAREAPDAAIK